MSTNGQPGATAASKRLAEANSKTRELEEKVVAVERERKEELKSRKLLESRFESLLAASEKRIAGEQETAKSKLAGRQGELDEEDDEDESD